jgi:predicted aldo/keto reductase-like oxidoreductase
MEYRTLGKTGLKVSVIGIGTLGFARAGLYEKGEEGIKIMSDIISKAIEFNINSIDTAYAYGKGIAEKAVGEAIKSKRDKVIILSRTHRWQTSEKPEDTEEIIYESLRNLKTDYIDIYQLHDVSSEKSYEKVINNKIYEVLVKAKEKGYIRFIGFSTHGDFQLKKKMIEEQEVDVMTIAYNPLYYKRGPFDSENIKETEEKFLPFAKKHNIGITVMKPFGGGILTMEMPGGKKLSPLKILRYIVENENIHTVTPGIENEKQLEEIVKAGDKEYSLSEEEKKNLLEEVKFLGTDFCRQCGYCMPCPQGINIPQIQKILLMWEIKKDEKIRENYIKLEKKASECIECKKCEEKCPYRIKITEKMKKAVEIFGV